MARRVPPLSLHCDRDESGREVYSFTVPVRSCVEWIGRVSRGYRWAGCQWVVDYLWLACKRERVSVSVYRHG